MQQPEVAEGLVSLRAVAEVALLTSLQSSTFIDRLRCPEASVTAYWKHARTLQQRWWRELEAWRQRFGLPHGLHRSEITAALSAMLEEYFVAELLTRVWTGILIAADRHDRTLGFEALARNVFLGQLQARRRALMLMLDAPAALQDAVVPADRLRRRCERWTDMLLGHLVEQYDLGEFVFEPARAREFGEERRQDPDSTNRPVHLLLQTGLRLAFNNHLPRDRLLGAEYAPLLRSILACFPGSAFDSSGLLRSAWQTRLERGSTLPESSPPIKSDLPVDPVTTPRSTLSFAALRRRFGRKN